MGFGDSASQMILFIAVITISAALVFVFNSYIDESAGTVSARQDFLNNQLRTSIVIESVSYSSGQITAYVKNIGDTRFYPNDTTVYVDRERIPLNDSISFVIESDTDTKNVGVFDSNEILKITINKTLSSSETFELLVTSPYNTQDSYEFST